MANNQYVNKLVKDGVTKLDLTGDTVTPSSLTVGTTAHNAAGEPIVGTLKAAGNVDLSASSVTVSRANPTVTVTLSNATGTVSISTRGSGFSATLNNNTITITRTTVENDSGLIIINVAENASAYGLTKLIDVTVEGIEFVTWADGTDEQVAKMIEAAQYGEIVLSDYWAAGDERIIDNQNVGTVASETLTLKLGSPINYTSINDTQEISNISIYVEIGSISAKKVVGYSYNSSTKKYSNPHIIYTGAQYALPCLPESLRNLIMAQKINNVTTMASYNATYARIFHPKSSTSTYYTGEIDTATTSSTSLGSLKAKGLYYGYNSSTDITTPVNTTISATSSANVISVLLI